MNREIKAKDVKRLLLRVYKRYQAKLFQVQIVEQGETNG
jgi:hypothetical protein